MPIVKATPAGRKRRLVSPSLRVAPLRSLLEASTLALVAAEEAGLGARRVRGAAVAVAGRGAAERVRLALGRVAGGVPGGQVVRRDLVVRLRRIAERPGVVGPDAGEGV